jgi:hypothetical protein
MKLCTPALIYVIFSTFQIFFDLYGRRYFLSISKLIVTIIFTYLLNLLCSKGLTTISWFLIALPFIFTLIFIEILLVSMGIQVLGNEAIEQINKIESRQNQMPNQNNSQNQNKNNYIDISYSEGPLNDTNNIENDLNNIDTDYPFDSN